jgi:hypothetical protein
VFVGLILFISRELENIKYELNNKLDKLTTHIDNYSKSSNVKIQSGFNMCVNKLKALNGDYIEQVRKMNNYENQPIMNISSNHYTDTDSKGGGIKFASLSDCKVNEEQVQVSKGKHVGDSFYMSEDEPKSNTTKKEENMFKIVLPASENKKLNESSSLDSAEILPLSNKQASVKKNTSHNSEELSSHNSQNQLFVNKSGFGTIRETDIVDSKESKNNYIDEETVSEQSSQQSEHSSTYDSITYGSKDKKKITNETESIATNNLKMTSINDLAPKEKYTSEALKKIAKDMSIPIFLKDGTTRRQMRKDELYEKIKSNLMTK